MSMDSSAAKTEKPTEQRLRKARERGQVAHSRDFTTAAIALAMFGSLQYFGPQIGRTLSGFLHAALSASAWRNVDQQQMILAIQESTNTGVMVLMPLFSLLVAVAWFANFVQVGWIWAPQRLLPDFRYVNPISGFGRMFSSQSAVRLAENVARIAILAAVAISFIRGHATQAVELGRAEVAPILAYLGNEVWALGIILSFTLLVIGVFDMLYTRWKHMQDLMMSKQEVRDEVKEQEGDAAQKQSRDRFFRELLKGQDLSRASEGTVVITNPTHIAVSVKYDPNEMDAPTVVAKGMGPVAARIRRIAMENGIPIIERKSLARALYFKVKVGEQIPVDLYEAFIAILDYVYRITGKTPKLGA